MAVAARPSAAHPAALPQPRRARRAVKPIARARTFGGVVWIVLFATLLAGVVAVNVAVLQLNVRLDELGRERVQLRADNARLSSEISRAGADARIESQARVKLGLEPAETTEFIDLAPAAASQAVSRTP
jgi:cell division protein FtsL